jgi:hypothetical protein
MTLKGADILILLTLLGGGVLAIWMLLGGLLAESTARNWLII